MEVLQIFCVAATMGLLATGVALFVCMLCDIILFDGSIDQDLVRFLAGFAFAATFIFFVAYGIADMGPAQKRYQEREAACVKAHGVFDRDTTDCYLSGMGKVPARILTQ